MAIDPDEEITFSAHDVAPAVDAVAEVVRAATGWVNLAPRPEPGAEAPRRNLFAAVFSSRGPSAPLITVSVADSDHGRLGLGLQHPGGPDALGRLAGLGHAVPAGWTKVADHPRRGLVVSAPGDAAPGEVVRWLLDAARLLSEEPLDGDWVARVYRG